MLVHGQVSQPNSINRSNGLRDRSIPHHISSSTPGAYRDEQTRRCCLRDTPIHRT
jgi:hypothetical protein